MSNLEDLLAPEDRDEVLRLVSVELTVPTDEQMAKSAATARSNGNEPPRPRASIHFVWEPLSVQLRDRETDEVIETTEDYIEVSFNLQDANKQPDMAAVQAIRDIGWPGIPTNKLIRVGKREWKDQERPWGRFFKRREGVLHLGIDDDGSITGRRGQMYSNDIGKAFRTLSGFDLFPTVEMVDGKWKNLGKKTDRWMMYVVEVANGYVAPEQPPVRHVNRNRTTDAVTTVTAGGLSATDLAAAVQEAGFIGASANMPSNVQQNMLQEAIARAPILGATELAEAAADGKLMDYLVGKGAIKVVDGLIAGV